MFNTVCTSNEGPVRIHNKCLVPICVFPEMKLLGLVIFKTELSCFVSQFPHSCICERFKYTKDRSAEDRSWEYIHECRNWERGHEVSFLGIYVSNFRYNVGYVQTLEDTQSLASSTPDVDEELEDETKILLDKVGPCMGWSVHRFRKSRKRQN